MPGLTRSALPTRAPALQTRVRQQWYIITTPRPVPFHPHTAHQQAWAPLQRNSTRQHRPRCAVSVHVPLPPAETCAHAGTRRACTRPGLWRGVDGGVKKRPWPPNQPTPRPRPVTLLPTRPPARSPLPPTSRSPRAIRSRRGAPLSSDTVGALTSDAWRKGAVGEPQPEARPRMRDCKHAPTCARVCPSQLYSPAADIPRFSLVSLLTFKVRRKCFAKEKGFKGLRVYAVICKEKGFKGLCRVKGCVLVPFKWATTCVRAMVEGSGMTN